MKERLRQYALLMRLHKPIGIFLLLWPTLWALWIAGEGRPARDGEKILTATITPVCSPKLIQERGSPDQPSDLLEFELIHVLGYDDDWHRWFKHSATARVKVPRGLSVDSSLIAIEAAQRGDGVMLGRRPFIDRHLQSGDLVQVFGDPYYLHSHYYLRQGSTAARRNEVGLVADWIKGLALES